MNKYQTGEYLIRQFDRYGTRAGKDKHASSYLTAEAMAEESMEEDGSFAILRVIKNSKDRK